MVQPKSYPPASINGETQPVRGYRTISGYVDPLGPLQRHTTGRRKTKHTRDLSSLLGELRRQLGALSKAIETFSRSQSLLALSKSWRAKAQRLTVR